MKTAEQVFDYPFKIVAVLELEDNGNYTLPHHQKPKMFQIKFLRDIRLSVEDVLDALRVTAQLNGWNPLGPGSISSANNYGVGVVEQYATFKQRMP